jgi:hypothetical protein
VDVIFKWFLIVALQWWDNDSVVSNFIVYVMMCKLEKKIMTAVIVE